jgi:hypothetical protein
MILTTTATSALNTAKPIHKKYLALAQRQKPFPGTVTAFARFFCEKKTIEGGVSTMATAPATMETTNIQKSTLKKRTPKKRL